MSASDLLHLAPAVHINADMTSIRFELVGGCAESGRARRSLMLGSGQTPSGAQHSVGACGQDREPGGPWGGVGEGSGGGCIPQARCCCPGLRGQAVRRLWPRLGHRRGGACAFVAGGAINKLGSDHVVVAGAQDVLQPLPYCGGIGRQQPPAQWNQRDFVAVARAYGIAEGID